MTDGLFLVARIGGRTVAIATAQVESVVDLGAIVPVPLAQPGVVGLTALRSRVVTVIDPCVALGLPPTGRAGRAVLSLIDDHHYAVLVDALDDVATLPCTPLAPGAGGGWQAAGVGIAERDGEVFLAIDLAALVPRGMALAA